MSSGCSSPVGRYPQPGEIVPRRWRWRPAGVRSGRCALQLANLQRFAALLHCLGTTSRPSGARAARGAGSLSTERRRRAQRRAFTHVDETGADDHRSSAAKLVPLRRRRARCRGRSSRAATLPTAASGDVPARCQRRGPRVLVAAQRRRVGAELDVLVGSGGDDAVSGSDHGEPRSAAAVRRHDLGIARRLGAAGGLFCAVPPPRAGSWTPTAAATASPLHALAEAADGGGLPSARAAAPPS